VAAPGYCRVSLVLLDLVMPLLDGWGFLDGVRKLQLPQPQTIVGTSYLPLLLQDEASPMEARVVLETPFALNQALRTVEELTAA
jgi:CheY-like chemotaxis protein